MSFLLLAVSAICAWSAPLLGMFTFMLLQTPIGNVGGALFHPLLGKIILIVSVGSILVDRGRPMRATRLNSLEVCALLFSGMVSLRELMSDSYTLSMYANITVVFNAALWGPLLVAIGRLRPMEMRNLRLYMALCGVVVGVWGGLILLTGNDYLRQTAFWGGPESDEFVKLSKAFTWEEAGKTRTIVMGVYTVLPYAYYYGLMQVLSEDRKVALRWIVFVPGLIAMGLTVLLSVTRIALLSMAFTVVFVISGLLLGSGYGLKVRVRALLASVMMFATCVLLLSGGKLQPVFEHLTSRLEQLGVGDTGVQVRLEHTANAVLYLSQNLCFFGAPGVNPLLTANSSVDSALAPQVWLRFGLPAVGLFLVIWIGSYLNILRSWIVRTGSSTHQTVQLVVTAWAIGFLVAFIFGYSFLAPEAFFTMMFVSESTRLVTVDSHAQSSSRIARVGAVDLELEGRRDLRQVIFRK